MGRERDQHDPAILLRIEEVIQSAFEETRTVLFFVDRFLAIGDQQQILDALRALILEHKLDATAEVFCESGDSISVHQIGFPGRLPSRCPECGGEVLDEYTMRFEVTSEWRGRLESQSTSKKRPHSNGISRSADQHFRI